jgi:tetratricopeptide (TPR) repeat protein
MPGIAAAAFGLAGCSSRDRTAAGPQDASLDVFSQGPTPDGSVPLAAPRPPVVAYFGNDFRAAFAYQQLKARGVADDPIDQGCVYPDDRLLGSGDARIEPCEVRRFVYNRYLSYLDIAESLAEGTLPWQLDDRNEKTDFDRKVRERRDAAIDFLKKDVGLERLPADSDDYRRKMGIALLYFVDFPDDPAYIRAHREELLQRTAELGDQALGLASFHDFLFEKGGLGTFFFKEDPNGVPHEPALEALKKHSGSDFSKSMVLYSVFTEAGLDPYFQTTPMREIRSDRETETHEGNIRFYLSTYMTVGLKIGGQRQFFNLEARPFHRTTNDDSTVPLDRFLGTFWGIRGVDWFLRNGKAEEAIPLLQRATDLVPGRATFPHALALAWERTHSPEKAELAYREALRLDPDGMLILYNYGRFLADADRIEEALPLFLRAMQNPEWNSDMDKRYGAIPRAIKKGLKNPTTKEAAQELSNELENHQ